MKLDEMFLGGPGSLLNFDLTATRSQVHILALILVWVPLLPVWGLLCSPCLWALLLPPAVQRHAGEAKWKLYIACKCENECVWRLCAITSVMEWQLVRGVPSVHAGIITCSLWPWRRYRKWGHGWKVWLQLLEEKITRKRQSADNTIDKRCWRSAAHKVPQRWLLHIKDLIIIKEKHGDWLRLRCYD